MSLPLSCHCRMTVLESREQILWTIKILLLLVFAAIMAKSDYYHTLMFKSRPNKSFDIVFLACCRLFDFKCSPLNTSCQPWAWLGSGPARLHWVCSADRWPVPAWPEVDCKINTTCSWVQICLSFCMFKDWKAIREAIHLWLWVLT